jgi:hypothetical protein
VRRRAKCHRGDHDSDKAKRGFHISTFRIDFNPAISTRPTFHGWAVRVPDGAILTQADATDSAV